MVTEQKTPEEEKVVVVLENGTMSRSLVRPSAGIRWKADAIHVILRLLCVVSSVIALSFMVTAKQASSVSIYGFHLPVFSKWSYSESFEYLVGVSAAVAAHSLLQLLIGTSRLLKKSPMIPSRNHAWLIFAGDQCCAQKLQAFAYALISAGSAASGVTNLNHTGIRHPALPSFCKPLHKFCDHVGISIAFTFIGCLLLAASAIQDVIWLSNH
ncbi:CASP-like protein 3A1 isoform X1 [Prosopis cineraria]|uniref:CASP-like protein 3A1 isoform X1 n=1 Tax=Prosopis cineraria TaxID=364024 RepID=UPI002410391C|nr:CASP-like protein 3A1 isoform X1 [Prosopis cineraria]